VDDHWSSRLRRHALRRVRRLWLSDLTTFGLSSLAPILSQPSSTVCNYALEYKCRPCVTKYFRYMYYDIIISS
jgi:hypothetical protein